MLLFDCKDDCHEELQNRAKQIKYSPEDMIKAPNAGAGLLLPRVSQPAAVQKLFDFFYDQYREKIYKWAREKGLQITKKTFRGPQIILLKDSGTLYVAKDRVLFSIVISRPSEHQFADEEHGYRGPKVKSSRVSQAEASSTNASPLPPASINIMYSTSDSSLRRTLTGLEIGDVIILEAGERLVVDGRSNSSKAQSICLVSATHITSSGMAGEGGWKEDAVKEEEGNEYAI
ncbi:hypothetical protein IWW34DRAFT_765766 [Fusarium oxysporum f. sp. albedinis]|nr:hypothetical protein IWW34DRAFT_765766 [Fusarium oxysporum f. sp. albedinis]